MDDAMFERVRKARRAAFNFGKNLKRLRRFNRMTMRDMKDRYGISATSISKYERGEAEPTLENALYICDVFGVELKDMAYGTVDELGRWTKC